MQQVLVLNYDYTPLNVTSVKRGFVLVDKGKAEIIKHDENPIVTTYKTYVRPVIIRLLRYINYRGNGVSVNRHRIFRRDGYQCAYCGSTNELTIDHIVPRSKAGRNTWTNLVSCCFRCNLKKGDKTPEEAHMQLRVKPTEPEFIHDHNNLNKAWDSFKQSFLST